MKKKLIAVDLDGTALHDHHQLNEDSKRALMAAKEAGHTVVIATGRPYRGSLKFYRELGLDTPIINFNGAYIHHPANHEFEEIIEQITIESAMEIFDSPIKEHIINAVCEYKDHLYILNKESFLGEWVWMDNVASVKYGVFSETLDTPPSGFVMQVTPGTEHEVMDYIRTHFSNVVSCRNWGDGFQNIIEVYKMDINKGVAIGKVAKQLGFDVEDIIVFGDGDNDMEMIQYAGVGVAMENGLDELKAVANHITKRNTEGGIAHYLYEHVLK